MEDGVWAGRWTEDGQGDGRGSWGGAHLLIDRARQQRQALESVKRLATSRRGKDVRPVGEVGVGAMAPEATRSSVLLS